MAGTTMSSQPHSMGLASVDALTVMSQQFPEEIFVIDDLLHEGATILSGPPKIGKSWLALQFAVAVACGSPLLGQYSVRRPGPVLYLGLEDTMRRLNKRLNDLTYKQHGLGRLGFVCDLPDGKRLTEGAEEHISAILRETPHSLLVIDTMNAAFPPITHRDVVRTQYNQSAMLCKMAEEHKVAVLVIAHNRKATAESGVEKVSGTFGVTGGLDSVLTLDRSKSGVTLEVNSREAEHQVLNLALDVPSGGWQIVQPDQVKQKATAREDILGALANGAELLPKEITAKIGKSSDAVRQMLMKMKNENLVEQTETGRYKLYAPPADRSFMA